MAEVVVLNGIETDLDSAIGRNFVTDCVRAGEGVITDSDLCLKYEIEPETLATITQIKSLIKAVRTTSEQRVRSGVSARELAAKIHARAPLILGNILDDQSANARHKIECVRELRATATANTNAEGINAERFVITIDLGADHIQRYEKTITPVKELAPAHKDTIDHWEGEER
jgi:hypothetical protein